MSNNLQQSLGTEAFTPQTNSPSTVQVYTDGACSGNPGPGGWGCVLLCDDRGLERGGYCPDTTNNRMELTAAIEALSSLTKSTKVSLFTDSKYICDAFQANWIAGWQKKQWRTSAGTPVKNQDLWLALIKLTQIHRVTWHWVKGHNGDRWNERCDAIAREAIRQKAPWTKHF